MAFIKNIEHEEIVRLADEISANTGRSSVKHWRRTAASVSRCSLLQGEEIGTHDSAGDAMVTVIEGKGRFVVDGREYCLSAGETLVMPARKPHSVHAEDAFKMLLTVVFPRNDSET